MLDPSHPIIELLKEDDRYAFDAYVFVFEALNYAQNVLQMGSEFPAGNSDHEFDEEPDDEEEQVERHVTGQQLCEAIREYALHQYGYMAKDVLGSWGIKKTEDFGEIVFNLIRIEQMRKTPQDRKEDFQNVYDFETAFRKGFKINAPEEEI
ncbi:MAG: hypothetical protein JXM70_27070 [Pirellulales bacterium]|nr:hypothetical protein [Pirellulales bacterium]